LTSKNKENLAAQTATPPHEDNNINPTPEAPRRPRPRRLRMIVFYLTPLSHLHHSMSLPARVPLFLISVNFFGQIPLAVKQIRFILTGKRE